MGCGFYDPLHQRGCWIYDAISHPVLQILCPQDSTQFFNFWPPPHSTPNSFRARYSKFWLNQNACRHAWPWNDLWTNGALVKVYPAWADPGGGRGGHGRCILKGIKDTSYVNPPAHPLQPPLHLPLGHGTYFTLKLPWTFSFWSEWPRNEFVGCIYFCFPVALTNPSIGTQKLTKFYFSTSS